MEREAVQRDPVNAGEQLEVLAGLFRDGEMPPGCVNILEGFRLRVQLSGDRGESRHLRGCGRELPAADEGALSTPDGQAGASSEQGAASAVVSQPGAITSFRRVHEGGGRNRTGTCKWSDGDFGFLRLIGRTDSMRGPRRPGTLPATRGAHEPNRAKRSRFRGPRPRRVEEGPRRTEKVPRRTGNRPRSTGSRPGRVQIRPRRNRRRPFSVGPGTVSVRPGQWPTGRGPRRTEKGRRRTEKGSVADWKRSASERRRHAASPTRPGFSPRRHGLLRTRTAADWKRSSSD